MEAPSFRNSWHTIIIIIIIIIITTGTIGPNYQLITKANEFIEHNRASG